VALVVPIESTASLLGPVPASVEGIESTAVRHQVGESCRASHARFASSLAFTKVSLRCGVAWVVNVGWAGMLVGITTAGVKCVDLVAFLQLGGSCRANHVCFPFLHTFSTPLSRCGVAAVVAVEAAAKPLGLTAVGINRVDLAAPSHADDACRASHAHFASSLASLIALLRTSLVAGHSSPVPSSRPLSSCDADVESTARFQVGDSCRSSHACFACSLFRSRAPALAD